MSSSSTTSTSSYLDTTLIPQQSALIDKKFNTYSYAYKPLPVSPLPNTWDEINKTVTITPVGTFPADVDGSNKLDSMMSKLPVQQTPESCIINAANIRSNYVPDTPVSSSSFGTFTKTAKTASVSVGTKTKSYKTTTAAGYIPGLHFQVGETYQETPNACEATGVTVSMNTNANVKANTINYPTQNLPTKFTDLGSATSTNLTPTGSAYTISPNSRNLFVVEWWGYFCPDVTGTWKFSTTSDDYSYLWIGSVAWLGDYTTSATKSNTFSNAAVNNQSLHGMSYADSSSYATANPTVMSMTAGTYYPIRIQFGQNYGGADISVVAYRPDGTSTSDFTNLFFTPTLVSKTVPVYSTSSTSQSIDMSSMYNAGFSSTDAHPALVALVKDKTTGYYDCYINNQGTDSQSQISSYLSGAGNASIYNVINMWQSTVQGDVYNGYCNVGSDAGVYLDGSTSNSIPTVADATGAQLTSGGLPETHYMYINEVTDSNGYVVPKIYIMNTTTGTISRIDIESSSTYKTNYTKFAKYQKPNLSWIYAQGRYLVYSEEGAANDPLLGRMYKITKTDPIVSTNSMYRLIMMNGLLTLQMCIFAPKKYSKNSNISYVDKDLVSSTYGLMKVDVNQQTGQVSLYDKVSNVTYYVPQSYTTLGSTYTTYDAFPYIAPGGTSTSVFTGSTDECKAACSADTTCEAVYSYTDGGVSYCKTQKLRDPPDPSVFNPASNKSSITQSKLYVKDRTIDPTYNTSSFDVNNFKPYINLYPTTFTKGETPAFSNQTFYPDNPAKNNNNNYDTLKREIATVNKAINDYMNDPDNITPLNLSQPNMMDASAESFISGSNLYMNNLQGYSLEGYADLSNQYMDTVCNSGATDYGACLMKTYLYQANQKRAIEEQNDAKLYSNYQSIKSKLADIDSRYKTMATIPASGNNVYNADFNDYDDSPDNTILAALQTDANQILLNQNTMYIVGTITTASLVILAIILARG